MFTSTQCCFTWSTDNKTVSWASCVVSLVTTILLATKPVLSTSTWYHSKIGRYFFNHDLVNSLTSTFTIAFCRPQALTVPVLTDGKTSCSCKPSLSTWGHFAIATTKKRWGIGSRQMRLGARVRVHPRRMPLTHSRCCMQCRAPSPTTGSSRDQED